VTFTAKLKNRIKQNDLARILIEERKRKKYEKLAKTVPDREFIESLYEKRIGRKPDLDNPRTFTEKLQWLKLNYRNRDIPLASDKYEAKKYIERAGFPDLLIPTLAVYDSADEISPDDLPEKFIIKATHGSGWNFICTDKNSFDLKRKRRIMNSWLKQNLYVYGREWNYREQTPRLIVEPLIDDKPLVDYKFLCFNGVCRAVQVNHDENGIHYVDYYDSDWNLYRDMSSGTADIFGKAIDKPKKFDRMKEIAENISGKFPFVRVDFYNVDEKIYFGEMTFFPGSGFWRITPEKYDKMFGEWLNIEELFNEQNCQNN
jgi:hypothetical protein